MVTRDLLWKGVITSLADDFLAFFFPEVFPHLDLEKGVEFLDKELEQLVPKSERNQRYVDKLIKVFLKDGKEHYFLIHIEVQGYVDTNFAERMFIYFYRLFDRYRLHITSLAIFTDNSPSFHPKVYQYKFLNTELTYRFQTYKLMDQLVDELQNSSNPFAIVMETARLSLDKKFRKEDQLYNYKIQLARKLIGRDYNRTKIKMILNFIVHYQPLLESKISRKFEEKISNMNVSGAKGLLELLEEEMLRQSREEGIEVGREEGREEVITQLLKSGLSLEEISKMVKISIDELQKIKNNIPESN